MLDHKLIGKHVSEFLHSLDPSLTVPEKAPEGDPDYGQKRYIECPDQGFAVLIDTDDICRTIQLFSAGKEPSYSPYTGDLPGGVRFGTSREEARAIMGKPVKSSDGGPTSKFGIEHRPWDSFASDGVKVHFEYARNCQSILMVSIMSPLPQG